uniref:Uncharacterized protein n=1 Tax=Kalanchoe fedtschenkoi TaxID=63787 RepID=A0A7N0TT51_KALFE
MAAGLRMYEKSCAELKCVFQWVVSGFDWRVEFFFLINKINRSEYMYGEIQ